MKVSILMPVILLCIKLSVLCVGCGENRQDSPPQTYPGSHEETSIGSHSVDQEDVEVEMSDFNFSSDQKSDMGDILDPALDDSLLYDGELEEIDPPSYDVYVFIRGRPRKHRPVRLEVWLVSPTDSNAIFPFECIVSEGEEIGLEDKWPDGEWPPNHNIDICLVPVLALHEIRRGDVREDFKVQLITVRNVTASEDISLTPDTWDGGAIRDGLVEKYLGLWDVPAPTDLGRGQ